MLDCNFSIASLISIIFLYSDSGNSFFFQCANILRFTLPLLLFQCESNHHYISQFHLLLIACAPFHHDHALCHPFFISIPIIVDYLPWVLSISLFSPPCVCPIDINVCHLHAFYISFSWLKLIHNALYAFVISLDHLLVHNVLLSCNAFSQLRHYGYIMWNNGEKANVFVSWVLCGSCELSGLLDIPAWRL